MYFFCIKNVFIFFNLKHVRYLAEWLADQASFTEDAQAKHKDNCIIIVL